MAAAAAAATGTVFHDGGALQLTPLSEWRDARKRARGARGRARGGARRARQGRAGGARPPPARAARRPSSPRGSSCASRPCPRPPRGARSGALQGFGPVERRAAARGAERAPPSPRSPRPPRARRACGGGAAAEAAAAAEPAAGAAAAASPPRARGRGGARRRAAAAGRRRRIGRGEPTAAGAAPAETDDPPRLPRGLPRSHVGRGGRGGRGGGARGRGRLRFRDGSPKAAWRC